MIETSIAFSLFFLGLLGKVPYFSKAFDFPSDLTFPPLPKDEDMLFADIVLEDMAFVLLFLDLLTSATL